MKKVVIIGGGASGLVAAIYAAKTGNQVIVIERNNTCGKKLLLTGNGKCNYWNSNQDLKNYNTLNPEVLKKIITISNQEYILSFFDSLGIIPKIKNGCYYPYSNQAISIKYALVLECKLLGVQFINDQLVSKIEKKKNQFVIETITDKINADKVILANGSKAAPKTGTDGTGYQLAKDLNHSIIKPLPALVSLKGNEKYFKSWAGIRTDVTVSLNDKQFSGEIQLTDYGVSGICVFNLSSDVAKLLNQNKKVSIGIDFMPMIKIKEINQFINWIDKRNKQLIKRKINELFDGILNYKLVQVLLEISHINKEKYWNDLTKQEQYLLAKNIKEFSLNITNTNSFDKAQVCSGGVPLNEIDPNTMESLKVKDLYIVGELLDVDGICGGYNLSFSWISGMLAGKATGDK